MSDLRIITNHVPRDIIDAWELAQDERDAFDCAEDDATFFRYRGELYDLSEFTVWDNPASPTRDGWDGFRSDSSFSGLVVRYVDDFERVIVGLALA